ncbi:MAG: hypothetical protein ACRD12_21080, partial [Acidimicrobiales bacterium]
MAGAIGLEVRHTPGWVEAWRNTTCVARIAISGVDPLRLMVRVESHAFGREGMQALVAVLLDLGGGAPLLLDTADLLLRYEARRAGFGGGLRLPL